MSRCLVLYWECLDWGPVDASPVQDQGVVVNAQTTAASDPANVCRRELELEVPADAVQKQADEVVKAFQRQARVAGFRPGKTPLNVVRQRFRDDIRQEIVRRLVPDYLHRRLKQENLEPVETPQIEDLRLELD